MGDARFYARSASDRTDDWPYWFVADRLMGGLNVTERVLARLPMKSMPGAVLMGRKGAKWLADMANAMGRHYGRQGRDLT